MHYNFYYTYNNPFKDLWIWVVVVIAAILLMICFLGKQNRGKYQGFLGHLYDFLNFRSFTLASVMKFIYLVAALGTAITTILGLFNNGFGGFLAGLLGLVIAEVLIRIMFEFLMLLIIGVSNVIEINDKLGGGNSDKPTFVEPDTEKYANKLSKQATVIGEKIKEKTENKKPEASNAEENKEEQGE